MPAGFFGFDDDGSVHAYGLKVGQEGLEGTKFDRIRVVTAAVNPASIATLESGETAVTITGVAAGDVVFANPPASLETGLAFSGVRVSAADTVQVRLTNVTAGAVDGASRTWTFLILEAA